MDMCLEHGADINDESTIVFRMYQQGFTRRRIGIFTVTPVLVYLLCIPWRDLSPASECIVVQGVSFLLDRGAYLPKPTHNNRENMGKKTSEVPHRHLRVLSQKHRVLFTC